MSSSLPESWSLATLAGQRLMIGFEGPACDTRIRRLLFRFRPAGVVLFATNVRSPDQLRRLISDLQTAASDAKIPPLIIAIDQEGGHVARLREPSFREYPSIRTLRTESEARNHARSMAKDLKNLGITMNLAPVLDVATSSGSIMLNRAFEGSAAMVETMGLAMIEEYQKQGVDAVAKHFPGIGRTVLDSHQVLPHLHTDWEELASSDLIPFRAAIQTDVPGIMVSHILYEKLDPQWPASLSVQISRNLLRDTMGYEGLVMTDDLDMKAIRLPMEKVMERMVAAEIDLGLICHEGPALEEAFETLVQTAENPEARKQFLQSAHRVLRLTIKKGLRN
ncbi:beta-N-acetylhexosaminidase [Desulfobotulus sp. H1]|uniref:beta-N-acetylhexosaminidase n=1 Tax=Desulfobotulus pelophilus TaxID=2823377 RepID=A0ABT3NB56_9BACT|nr:glycoside hydrolase family 3 N-terminal domain-containing protein [Desulfobotulus pelophilus]MCW7754683.1 beta-N-acetylhexosaminidase [Desulfobotulus pelophilus]